MSDPVCGICRKSIEASDFIVELGDQAFHKKCLGDAAQRTILHALADAKLGKPQ